jgi:hypothetical protein
MRFMSFEVRHVVNPHLVHLNTFILTTWAPPTGYNRCVDNSFLAHENTQRETYIAFTRP